MAGTWGTALRLSIFGESHGEAVGIVIDGLPPGSTVDPARIAKDMARRAPGGSDLTTSRREADYVEIISGVYDHRATGSPICGIIRNSNTRSGDYDSRLRPGHADLTALLKYGGHADMRGGGHFSGRLTAPLVFAGSLAQQYLEPCRIRINGRIASIAGIRDSVPPCEPAVWAGIKAKPFPVYDDNIAAQMRAAILEAKAAGDSVGGVTEAVAFGVPAGLGEPFFSSLESVLASLLFSIPAVKGVEFGDGFAIADVRGSEANDPIVLRDGTPQTASNHAGGINGGISNGAPLVVRAAIRPTPSIAREQETVDAENMQAARLEIKGRHDPCIVARAVPVIEACVALCVLDALLVGRWSQ